MSVNHGEQTVEENNNTSVKTTLLDKILKWLILENYTSKSIESKK